MSRILISVGGGIVGIAFFMLGAASSSGGYLKIFALPAFTLQFVSESFGIRLDELQLNQGAVIIQFLVYFVLTYLAIFIMDRVGNGKSDEFEK